MLPSGIRPPQTGLTKRLARVLASAGGGAVIAGLAGVTCGTLYGLLYGLTHGTLEPIVSHGLYFAACGALAGAIVGAFARITDEGEPLPSEPQEEGTSRLPRTPGLPEPLRIRIRLWQGRGTRDYPSSN